MRRISAVALLAVCASSSVGAQQSSRWSANAAVLGLVEAWDLNGAREQVHGVIAGIDLRTWRGVAVRGEAVRLLVAQRGADAWLTGGWLGLKLRGRGDRWRPFGELGAGRAVAQHPVPPAGTRWNYLLVADAGVEVPLPGPTLVLAMRWFHLSNDGSEGRSRNPDVQTLGGLLGFAWGF